MRHKIYTNHNFASLVSKGANTNFLDFELCMPCEIVLNINYVSVFKLNHLAVSLSINWEWQNGSSTKQANVGVKKCHSSFATNAGPLTLGKPMELVPLAPIKPVFDLRGPCAQCTTRDPRYRGSRNNRPTDQSLVSHLHLDSRKGNYSAYGQVIEIKGLPSHRHGELAVTPGSHLTWCWPADQ